jgi:hypothetical protein
VIIKRDHDHRIRYPPNPKPAQMMKIARPVERERGKARFKFTVKFLDQTGRSGETQSRTPTSRVQPGKMQRLFAPGLIQIEMENVGQKV